MNVERFKDGGGGGSEGGRLGEVVYDAIMAILPIAYSPPSLIN